MIAGHMPCSLSRKGWAMRTRLVSAVVVSVLLGTAGPAAGAGEPQKHVAAAPVLWPEPSEWVAVRGEWEGKAFSGGRLKVIPAGQGKARLELAIGGLGCFKLHYWLVRAGRYSQIDLTVYGHSDGLPATGDLVGIYRIDGDSLTLCMTTDPRDRMRPTEFATNKGDGGRLLFVFQRKK
jgi:uncharacterized protein (TIGR03067 family)